MGVLVLAPVILVWAAPAAVSTHWDFSTRPWRIVEACVLAALLIGVISFRLILFEIQRRESLAKDLFFVDIRPTLLVDRSGIAGLPKNDPNPLRDFATAKLKELYAAAYERRTPEEELTRFAVPLYERAGYLPPAELRELRLAGR